MRTLAVISALVMPVAAHAQGPSPSQLALSINAAVANLAQSLDAANMQAARTQAQVVDLQKQIVDLKTKCGKACEATPAN